MDKFFIINYKYCPNFTRFKLILDFYAMEYENHEVNDGESLTNTINSLFSGPQQNHLLNNFYSSLILYKNKIIDDTVSLIHEILLLKNIPLSSSLVDTLQQETWINNHILYEFYWLSVGNNILDIFRKPLLTSERNQVGNNILLQKFQLLNNFFSYNPWFSGEKIGWGDFSLFILLQGVVQKNSNIMINYNHVFQWYSRMNQRKDWLFFLKNQ
jgi:hypothetical protein